MQKRDFEAFHHVCGVEELATAPIDHVTKIVSITDPGLDVPLPVTDLPVLSLRFHDEIVPAAGIVLPTRADLRMLLAFDAGADPGDGILVHCQAGMSRSTASLALLLAQRHPDRIADIFPYILSIRKIAWPNSLMVEIGDGILGLNGELVRALREHYKVQIELMPRLRAELRAGGRGSEVPAE